MSRPVGMDETFEPVSEDGWKREAERLRAFCNRQRDEIETLNGYADAVEALRDIGKVTGCNHVDDPDGRRQLVNCVEQQFAKEHQDAERLRAANVRLSRLFGIAMRMRNQLRKGADAMVAYNDSLPPDRRLPENLLTPLRGLPQIDECEERCPVCGETKKAGSGPVCNACMTDG